MRSLIIALAILTGCAASSRETAIKTAYVTLHAADGSFVEYDATHQDEILAHSTSLEDYKAKVAKYRQARVKVSAALTAAGLAIKAAVSLNDDQSIASLKLAIADVVAAVAALKVSMP